MSSPTYRRISIGDWRCTPQFRLGLSSGHHLQLFPSSSMFQPKKDEFLCTAGNLSGNPVYVLQRYMSDLSDFKTRKDTTTKKKHLESTYTNIRISASNLIPVWLSSTCDPILILVVVVKVEKIIVLPYNTGYRKGNHHQDPSCRRHSSDCTSFQ